MQVFHLVAVLFRLQIAGLIDTLFEDAGPRRVVRIRTTDSFDTATAL